MPYNEFFWEKVVKISERDTFAIRVIFKNKKNSRMY